MRPDAVHQRGNFGVVGLTTCDLANYLTLDLFGRLKYLFGTWPSQLCDVGVQVRRPGGPSDAGQRLP